MLDRIVTCKNCGLHQNQPPLIDKTFKANIMWVGLSAKKVDNVEKDIPLSSSTNSGKLIKKIEMFSSQFSFYKTNLVKCVPLNSEGKLRYPNMQEMNLCFSNLMYEIETLKPKIVFLLGKDVSSFVFKNLGEELTKYNDNYHYDIFEVKNTYFVPIHHPSFISVYRRKTIDSYIKSIVNIISDNCPA